VQIDPIKPTLKTPGTKHLKLNCDVLLSAFGFQCNMRRYTMEIDSVHMKPLEIVLDLQETEDGGDFQSFPSLVDI
jgi:hypothetical protein